MSEPNFWQDLLLTAVVKFAAMLGEPDRDEAFGRATDIAQEIAAHVSERDMPLLLICCPELLTRQPEFYEDIVANAEHAPVCAAEFIRFNIEDLLEQYLEEFWLENKKELFYAAKQS